MDNNTFYEQIKSLNTSVIQAWVYLGNKAETFRDSGIKIVSILDNASFHKNQYILLKISADKPQIILSASLQPRL
jgi:hypothetical protein